MVQHRLRVALLLLLCLRCLMRAWEVLLVYHVVCDVLVVMVLMMHQH